MLARRSIGECGSIASRRITSSGRDLPRHTTPQLKNILARAFLALAFLFAVFLARPCPFYILDEVEAALDDTNLGRLIQLFEELRDSSQLIVITHQKKTMEIADALYGVTMRGDGITRVISQRMTPGDLANPPAPQSSQS